MLVSLKVEEQNRLALQAIDSHLKSLRFGKITLIVKDGEILDLIREERSRVSDLTPSSGEFAPQPPTLGESSGEEFAP